MEKFKNSNNGLTLNKIYSLFEDVNKMNKKFSPIKNNNFRKTSTYQPISTKYENESAGYPGVAVRIVNNDTKFSATSTKNGTRKQQNFPDNVTSVKLIRESGIIKYSYNNNIPITLENYNDFTEFFNTPVSIGGIIDSNNQIDRCIVMTISDLVIKMDP
jgi:hypothetical protein